MNKINRGVIKKARHKKILDRAKGYYGARSRTFKSANQAVIKAHQYAYRDRRVRKRTMRSLWIVRLNALAQQHGISYSVLINKLNQAGVLLNRKLLSDIAIYNGNVATDIVQIAKTSLSHNSTVSNN